MNLAPTVDRIPGTILDKRKMGNVTGAEFLGKIFYITRGIMLSQIREIAGIDGSTLPNWTKRGWVPNAHYKKYDIEQVSRILIINMLRSCMQLDRIIFLLRYINGRPEDNAAIIAEAKIYDCLCTAVERLAASPADTTADLRAIIDETLEGYTEPYPGARDRIATALEIMLVAHYAVELKARADAEVDALMKR